MAKWGYLILSLFFGMSSFAQNMNGGSTAAVASVYDMEALFREHQDRFLPVSPPSWEVFVQPYEWTIPVDMNRLPQRMLKNMVGELNANFVPLYRIFVYEDALSRETVFLNAHGVELERLVPEEKYDPLRWQTLRFNLSTTKTLDPFSAWIFDPAHVAAEMVLVPDLFYENYRVLEAYDSQTAEVMAMSTISLSVPAPPVDTNSPSGTATASSNSSWVTWHFSIPEGFGRYAEIFQAEQLPNATWTVAENRVAVTGGTELEWSDVTSSNVSTRFYVVNNADIFGGADSDGDGYSDGREHYITGTEPTVFDYRDTDDDGMHDWFETMLFGDMSHCAADDFDGDGLANLAEMELTTTNVVFLTDPSLADTDGGGINDGFETTNTVYGLNPREATDDTADLDADGLSNLEEYELGTKLDAWDSDGDGVDDPTEVALGNYQNANAVVANIWDWSDDSDGDGLTFEEEIFCGADPQASDAYATNNIADVSYTLGDISGLGWYWIWWMDVTGERSCSAICDYCTSSGTFKLRKGFTYDVGLKCQFQYDYLDGNNVLSYVAELTGKHVLIEDDNDPEIIGSFSRSGAHYTLFDPPTTESPSDTLHAKLHVVDIDLDIEGLAEPDEASFPGKVLALSNAVPMTLHLAPEGLPDDTSVELTVSDASKISIMSGDTEILGPVSSSSWEQDLSAISLPDDDLSLTVTGVETGSVTIAALFKDENGEEVCRDTIVVSAGIYFEAQDGMINYGFDPTGEEPWASVVVGKDNEVAQLVADLLPAGGSLQFVSANDCATISPTTCTSGTTELTLTGISAGTNCFKANYDGQTAANLNVISFEEQRLSVSLYRIIDSTSFATTNVEGPSAPLLEATLNDIYQQCGITFSVTDRGFVDTPYDVNKDGLMQKEESYTIFDHNWQDDLLILLANQSGQPYEEDPDFMMRGKSFGFWDLPMPRGGLLFVNGPHGLGSSDICAVVASHETGHVLDLPTLHTQPLDDHDFGPFPDNTELLMKTGAPVDGELSTMPGRWIRHKDWEAANKHAKELE